MKVFILPGLIQKESKTAAAFSQRCINRLEKETLTPLFRQALLEHLVKVGRVGFVEQSFLPCLLHDDGQWHIPLKSIPELDALWMAG